ncbi:MAG TPA: hypothetical protein VGL27_18180, partial [Negativicutes bacterium]
SGQQLEVRKGETVEAAGMSVKFIQFVMEEGNATGIVKAYALLAITKDGIVQEIKPGLMPGNGQLEPLPATAFDRYEINLTALSINKGLASIAIHDLTPSQPETVEAEISRKPLINLVWLGTTLITLGIGWTAGKRWSMLMRGCEFDV